MRLKENLNAPRLSEHPPVRGKKCQGERYCRTYPGKCRNKSLGITLRGEGFVREIVVLRTYLFSTKMDGPWPKHCTKPQHHTKDSPFNIHQKLSMGPGSSTSLDFTKPQHSSNANATVQPQRASYLIWQSQKRVFALALKCSPLNVADIFFPPTSGRCEGLLMDEFFRFLYKTTDLCYKTNKTAGRRSIAGHGSAFTAKSIL